MPKAFYLHAGHPKTATGFLQRVVLPHIENIDCYVKPTVRFGGARMSFGDLFIFPPDLWENSRGEPFSFLRDDSAGEQDVLLSSERIVGGIASPQPWIPDQGEQYGPIVRHQRQTGGEPDHASFGRHLGSLAKAVRRLGFSQVKVLLTVRRQDERLASSYAQVSDRVIGASQENFEQWICHLTGDEAGFHFGGGQKLDYHLWWKTMVEVLGERNVLFLPFELLRENQSVFLKRWLKFIGVQEVDSVVHLFSDSEEENRRSTSESKWSIRAPVRPRRVLQKLGLPTDLLAFWPDPQRGKEIQLTKRLSEEILEVYEQGNRDLDNQGQNLGLKGYGYY